MEEKTWSRNISPTQASIWKPIFEGQKQRYGESEGVALKVIGLQTKRNRKIERRKNTHPSSNFIKAHESFPFFFFSGSENQPH